MSDPKLREARIAEAQRRMDASYIGGNLTAKWAKSYANHLCDLIEQDWRPEPEVDAVTLAAREWSSTVDWRGRHFLGAFRAGHANGQANHPDTKRMDWLDSAKVVVDRGGFFFVHVSTDSDPLRTKIDRAMEGGQ